MCSPPRYLLFSFLFNFDLVLSSFNDFCSGFNLLILVLGLLHFGFNLLILVLGLLRSQSCLSIRVASDPKKCIRRGVVHALVACSCRRRVGRRKQLLTVVSELHNPLLLIYKLCLSIFHLSVIGVSHLITHLRLKARSRA